MAEALTVDIVDSAGRRTGSIELPTEVFDTLLSIPLMRQVVIGQLAAVRQDAHATKTRGGVRGGGRKPYRQKGVSHARQGSTRTPQFVGGGAVHGPWSRDYSQWAPKKIKAATLRNALSDYARNGRIHAIAEFVITTAPSAKNVLVTLRNFTDCKTLVIVDRQNDLLRLSLRNAPEAYTLWVDQLDIYDVFKSDDVIFTASGLGAFLGKGRKEPK